MLKFDLPNIFGYPIALFSRIGLFSKDLADTLPAMDEVHFVLKKKITLSLTCGATIRGRSGIQRIKTKIRIQFL
jgi:hypothetical protein